MMYFSRFFISNNTNILLRRYPIRNMNVFVKNNNDVNKVYNKNGLYINNKIILKDNFGMTNNYKEKTDLDFDINKKRMKNNFIVHNDMIYGKNNMNIKSRYVKVNRMNLNNGSADIPKLVELERAELNIRNYKINEGLRDLELGLEICKSYIGTGNGPTVEAIRLLSKIYSCTKNSQGINDLSKNLDINGKELVDFAGTSLLTDNETKRIVIKTYFDLLFDEKNEEHIETFKDLYNQYNDTLVTEDDKNFIGNKMNMKYMEYIIESKKGQFDELESLINDEIYNSDSFTFSLLKNNFLTDLREYISLINEEKIKEIKNLEDNEEILEITSKIHSFVDQTLEFIENEDNEGRKDIDNTIFKVQLLNDLSLIYYNHKQYIKSEKLIDKTIEIIDNYTNDNNDNVTNDLKYLKSESFYLLALVYKNHNATYSENFFNSSIFILSDVLQSSSGSVGFIDNRLHKIKNDFIQFLESNGKHNRAKSIKESL